VISSDAHHPSEVARDFPQAIELAKAAGYRETVLFEKRKRRSEVL
jgi:histidinol-phosphatase (PHP family)